MMLIGTGAFSVTARREQPSHLPPDIAVADERAAEPLPAQVVYSAFFHFVVELQRQAVEIERNAEDSDSVRNHIRREAGLSSQESSKLHQIAQTCVGDVAVQDAKAVAVIQKFRSQFPGGRIASGMKLPPPPPELTGLQQERDQIILRARNNLISVLGESGFKKVESFIERRIMSGIRPVEMRPQQR
jgi:hypothetical protein